MNVRVKKTTEAFSNYFLGVGNAVINPVDPAEKVHKGWGSADNVNKVSNDFAVIYVLCLGKNGVGNIDLDRFRKSLLLMSTYNGF